MFDYELMLKCIFAAALGEIVLPTNICLSSGGRGQRRSFHIVGIRNGNSELEVQILSRWN